MERSLGKDAGSNMRGVEQADVTGDALVLKQSDKPHVAFSEGQFLSASPALPHRREDLSITPERAYVQHSVEQH